MYFTFNSFGDDVVSIDVSIFQGTQLVNKQRISGPSAMLQMQILQLVQQLSQQPSPMKLMLEREEQTFDAFEQKMVSQKYTLTYWNKQETW